MPTPRTPRLTPADQARVALADAVDRMATAEADRDAAIVALRHEGETLAAIARHARLSAPGVLKLLRRHEVGT